MLRGRGILFSGSLIKKALKTMNFELFGLQLLSILIVGLGTLLLVIPGLILGFGLQRAIYIKHDNPSISIDDALKKSWNDMKGYKTDLFLTVLPAALILGVIVFILMMFFGLLVFGSAISPVEISSLSASGVNVSTFGKLFSVGIAGAIIAIIAGIIIPLISGYVMTIHPIYNAYLSDKLVFGGPDNSWGPKVHEDYKKRDDKMSDNTVDSENTEAKRQNKDFGKKFKSEAKDFEKSAVDNFKEVEGDIKDTYQDFKDDHKLNQSNTEKQTFESDLKNEYE